MAPEAPATMALKDAISDGARGASNDGAKDAINELRRQQ
jgi:hypothetical protein